MAGWINMVSHPDLTDRYYVPSGPDAFLVWAKAGQSTDKSYRSGIPMLSCSLTLDPWRKPARATTSTPAIVLRQDPPTWSDGRFPCGAQLLHQPFRG